MAGPGGLGQELFGDPMAAGGPISIAGVRAVQSQVVRVAFTVQPINVSPGGRADALNPANYSFSVVSGAATVPQAVGVAGTLIVGPAAVVGSGQYGADVFVDRALILGITYQVSVQNIMARFGGMLGSPTSASFPGAAKITVKFPPQPRKLELIDVASDPILGGFTVDDSGDLAVQSGADGLRKRMLRRAYTAMNAFAFLPGYGTGLRLKKNFSPPQQAAFKADLEGQLKQEPEVADAAVQVTQQVFGANGVTTVDMTVRTKVGSIVSATTTVQAGGIAIP